MSLRQVGDRLCNFLMRKIGDRRLVLMSRVFKHDIQHRVRLAICIKRFWRPVANWSPTSHQLVADRFYLIANMSPCHSLTGCRSIADQLQTCWRLVGNYNLYPYMGINWLHKSHRSPVSCKEISHEQVADRLRSR